jgi:hypothetical protein
MATKEKLVDASTPLLDDVDVVHVVQVGLCEAHFRGTTFSSYTQNNPFFGVMGLVFGGHL